MNYFVYILKSDNFERYYIGQTSNLQNRLKEHNSKKVFSTKPFSPWKIIHFETFTTRTEAIQREHFLKSHNGWIELLSIKRQNNI
jgi:putative endonuclease